ncbi:MAG: response regulator [Deltaproteobacteria bacterium]|nr:response regulator [Deltaproteobacteria bacterium]
MKVLIAEDDFTSRTILQAILTSWGYEVVATADGESALAAMQQPDAPHLALLDWMMPGMEGPAVCHELRKLKRRDPVYLILLTSKGERGDIVQGLEAGADDYIAKPYNNEELRARVQVGKRMVTLQNELREWEKLQGVLEMAGAVCHEQTQPLQCISGYSELLLMDLNEKDPKCEMLKKIKSQVDRLGELTRKIMKITRYQSKPYLSKTRIIDIECASQIKREDPDNG